MKNIIKYVILGILLITVIILGVMSILKNNNSVVEKYQFYDDDLIHIDNQTSMKVQANIMNSETLGILISSDLDDFFLTEIEVTFYDDNQEKVSTSTNELTVFDHGKQFTMFVLPNLYEKGAGAIDIKITGKKTNDGSVSSSQLQMTETHSIDESFSTNFKVQVTNNSKVDIPALLGEVVLLKNGKIVGYQSFTVYDLIAHSTLSSDVVFESDRTASQTTAIDFDEVSLFPIYIFNEEIE